MSETTANPTPEIVAETQREIERLWGLQSNRCSFKCIKHSENHTYLITEESKEGEGGSSSRRFILRLTPDDHRKQEAIEAELNFVLRVARESEKLCQQPQQQHVFRLCCPIPTISDSSSYLAVLNPYGDSSHSGNDDKKVTEKWFASVFEHAKGSSATDEWKGMVDEGIIASWGRSLGEFHDSIVRAKRSNPVEWHSTVEFHIPEWFETHGGGASVQVLEERGQVLGDEKSKLLFNVWKTRVEPFLASLGDKNSNDAIYGVIHGDLNVSNFFSETLTSTTKTDGANPSAESSGDSLPRLWLFDFDQAHHNWFGFDLGVVLQGVQFFEDMKWIDPSRYNPTRFREIFLREYRKANPAMVAAGHTEPEMLKGFEEYREFFHTAIAVDLLFKAKTAVRQVEPSIVGFCELLAQRFISKYSSVDPPQEKSS